MESDCVLTIEFAGTARNEDRNVVVYSAGLSSQVLCTDNPMVILDPKSEVNNRREFGPSQVQDGDNGGFSKKRTAPLFHQIGSFELRMTFYS